MKLAGLEPSFRQVVDYALAVLAANHVGYTVTSGYRSLADQARLYAARARNPYPVAPPGASAHNYGLALDVVGTTPRDQQAVVYVFSALGFKTVAGDKPHWEHPYWRQLVRR